MFLTTFKMFTSAHNYTIYIYMYTCDLQYDINCMYQLRKLNLL